MGGERKRGIARDRDRAEERKTEDTTCIPSKLMKDKTFKVKGRLNERKEGERKKRAKLNSKNLIESGERKGCGFLVMERLHGSLPYVTLQHSNTH